jgi:tetratricopeptide (TPR) repeat protein
MLRFWLGPAVWLVSCGHLSAHGAIHERILSISRQIEERPHEAGLFSRRADLERQHHEWDAALADIERARQLDPAMDLDSLLGRTLQEAGRSEQALVPLDRAISHKPDDRQAMVSRARAMAALDRRREAIVDFRKVLKDAPIRDPEVVMECADSLMAEGLEKEAREVLADSIATLGAVPRLVLRAIDLELAARDFDTALGHVAAMLESAVRPEPWMAKRAAILQLAGRNAESSAAWRELAAHLESLPNLERGNPAMMKLMDDAKLALANLESLSKHSAPPGP